MSSGGRLAAGQRLCPALPRRGSERRRRYRRRLGRDGRSHATGSTLPASGIAVHLQRDTVMERSTASGPRSSVRPLPATLADQPRSSSRPRRVDRALLGSQKLAGDGHPLPQTLRPVHSASRPKHRGIHLPGRDTHHDFTDEHADQCYVDEHGQKRRSGRGIRPVRSVRRETLEV